MTPRRAVLFALLASLAISLWGAQVAAQGSAVPEGFDRAEVKLRDQVVFVVGGPRAGLTAAERAAAASAALELAIEAIDPDDIRTEQSGAGVVIFAAANPIITLTADDARRAGDEALDVYAARTTQLIREAVRKEKQRSRIATTVFSLSLVVFSGLIAIYLSRKVRDVSEAAREWLSDDDARIPAIRLRSIEVVRPALLRSMLSVALLLGLWLGQLGLLYTWLAVTLSLFESTRGYTDKLTGVLVAPLSALMGRVATSLPLLLVGMTAAVAVFLLVRFAGVFFEGVERGETSVAGLSPDLVRPTSLLVRGGIVVAAFVFGAPVVTGDPEGALARTGAVALGALGVASVPLLACSVVGLRIVYGGRLRAGELVEIGGVAGRIVRLTLLEVVLEEAGGAEVRVPHLLTLVRPTRVLGRWPPVRVEIAVAAGHSEAIESALLGALGALGELEDPSVELIALGRRSARYRLSARCAAPGDEVRLIRAALAALAELGIDLVEAEASKERA